MPYWLRGGVIGGGISLVSTFLTSFCEYIIMVPGYTGLGFECLPFAIPWIPFWSFKNIISLSVIEYTIAGTAVWFVFGSLVGSIIKFIKLRNSK